MRLQLALNVRDLDEAVAYYGELFNAEPHKRHPGYTNFAIDQPPLKLVLFEDSEAAARLGLSTSGMKSRVQRGRSKLEQAILRCCAVALDCRGEVIGCEPHRRLV